MRLLPSFWRRLLTGHPLPTEERSQECLTKLAAPAVFASDGVVSVAYATEEILLTPALAGTAQLRLSMPIASWIALLIAVLATSFRQVVHAYPHGGGSYAVARGNLGAMAVQDSISLFLNLRAFSCGCAALTGMDAVRDGVTAFRGPVSRNAAAVMAFLVGILGTLLIGITSFANRLPAMPVRNETVVSHIAVATFGRDWGCYAIRASATVIPIRAANRRFNGFPRLASVQAAHRSLPHQPTNLGDRLVYSNGILTYFQNS